MATSRLKKMYNEEIVPNLMENFSLNLLCKFRRLIKFLLIKV